MRDPQNSTPTATKVFSGPDDERLPSNVQALSQEKRAQWVGAWNGRFKECQEGGDSDRECESSAFAVANAAVKKELDPDEAAKFYNGMVESWDIYGRQFPQGEVNYNSLGATDERGCANCRWFITPGACVIVESYPDPITPNGISDKWEAQRVFEPEPLRVVVVEEGSASMDDGAGDKANKTEGGIEFPSSDYAVVPDAEKPSGWKLRLAEGSAGNQTVAQIGRAITALQPSGFRGQRVQLTSDEKSGAIRKINGAIGRISGATTEQKQNLRDRLDAVKERLVEVHVTVPQRLLSTVKATLGNLLKAGIPDLEHVPPIVFAKDVNGDIRWVMWASNQWRDRDGRPEILESKAHLDYVAHVDRTGDFPEAWLWHTPGTKWGQADWVDFVDGFLMVSGTVDSGMEHVADALAQDKSLGVSHGYRYLHSDEKNGIVGWYRTFEVSPLPIKAAANPWTSLEVLTKEIEMGLSKDKREFLVTHLGEEQVSRLEGDTGALKAALEKAGVEWKDMPEDTEGAAPAGSGSVDLKALAEETGKAAALALVETPAFKTMVEGQATLAEQIKGLTERMADLEKSEDEKIAAAIGGRSHRAAGYHASSATDNHFDPNDPASKTTAEAAAAQGPGVEFFDQIMEGLEVQATPS